MKLFGLISGAAAVSEGITQYNDKNGNVVTIDPGCPTLWPKKLVFLIKNFQSLIFVLRFLQN